MTKQILIAALAAWIASAASGASAHNSNHHFESNNATNQGTTDSHRLDSDNTTNRGMTDTRYHDDENHDRDMHRRDDLGRRFIVDGINIRNIAATIGEGDKLVVILKNGTEIVVTKPHEIKQIDRRLADLLRNS